MAIIYNSDLTKELFKGAKLQLRDRIPSELAEKVVPVMEVNPNLLRTQVLLGSVTKLTSGSSEAFTASTTKETFVTGFIFNYTKDAACDVATGTITCSLTDEITGSAVVGRLPVITLTASSGSIEMEFNRPIKLKKGSQFVFGNDTFAAGVFVRSLMVFGYTIDNPNA